jgi:hypothetical protein
MISALYNVSLPVFNEEWHPRDNVVGKKERKCNGKWPPRR